MSALREAGRSASMQVTRQVQQPLQRVEGAARKAAPPPPRWCSGLGMLGRDGKRGRFVEVLGEERCGEDGIGTRGRDVVDDGLRRAILRAAVGRPDKEDVRGEEGEEGGGDPDGDGAGEQHGEEVAERDEEEADVAHEPGALDLDGASSGPGRRGLLGYSHGWTGGAMRGERVRGRERDSRAYWTVEIVGRQNKGETCYL
ncbi:hypothetical protein ZEAMMB73_Zm00001d006660 [Zea mays]|uniref:Uncharacterized protein n=1 Tax=Zea mays TaxID=4577 RepID=A0A1D6EZH5_MAIZE|nr:hypothetical protein ZEAMMB73_Zm00001d006660 [Zea mays]